MRRKQTSVLAMSSDFVGQLAYSGTLEILGRVEGDITVSGKVIVGPSGCCISNIKADAVEIYGEVQGNVDTMVLKLAAGGKLIGDAKYKSIIMEEGSVFEKLVSDHEETPASPVETELGYAGSVTSTVAEVQDPPPVQADMGAGSKKQLPGEVTADEEVPVKPEPSKKPRFQTVF
jgi:cytoskeletal protein CcmA (bactofilin family)